MTPYLRAKACLNAEKYAKSKGLATQKTFGYGQEGYVLQTNKRTAIKAFYYDVHFHQELEIYQYLQRWGIVKASGFNIPQLLDHSVELQIIEMEVVQPPFIVDFVGARLEIPFERDDDWEQSMKDVFESDWKAVARALFKLENEGVYLSDIHLGNIRCR